MRDGRTARKRIASMCRTVADAQNRNDVVRPNRHCLCWF